MRTHSAAEDHDGEEDEVAPAQYDHRRKGRGDERETTRQTH